MLIRFGSTSVVDHRNTARVRATVAGLISGTVSVAAHGSSASVAAPDSTAIMLLGVTAAVLGALIAGLPRLRTGAAGLTAVLTTGQLLGHLCLGWDSGHLQHGELLLSPTMIAAHVLAAGAAALVIHGVETAYRAGMVALARLVLLLREPAATGPVTRGITHRDRVIPRLVVTGTGGTRAPPVTVLP